MRAPACFASVRDLDRYPEPELAALGLFSPERQALVYRRCFEDVLAPKLKTLSLI